VPIWDGVKIVKQQDKYPAVLNAIVVMLIIF